MPLEQIGNMTLWQARMFTCSEDECSMEGEDIIETTRLENRSKRQFKAAIEREVERWMSGD